MHTRITALDACIGPNLISFLFRRRHVYANDIMLLQCSMFQSYVHKILYIESM